MLDCLDARNISTQLAELAGIAELLCSQLHTQRKLGLAYLKQLLAKFSIVLVSQFVRFHCLPQMARYKSRRDRQFRSCQTKRFAGQCLIYAIHLI